MSQAGLGGFKHITNGRFDAAAAPLLLLHKTGGDEHELLPLARAVAPDRAVVALRGPVLEEGKARFFRRLSAGVFDEADLRRRARDLDGFVEEFVERQGCLPPIALGVSNGANMALAAALLNPKLFSALVLLRPARPFADLPSCMLSGVPVLLVAGRDDRTVSRPETEKLAAHIWNCGADVTIEHVPGGHRVGDPDIEIVRDWLADRESRSQGILCS